MKTRHRVCGLLLAGVLAGCGLYTNIPAQVNVEAPADGAAVATVTYAVQQGSISADVQNPTIALEGEPGSIGVTYNQIAIEYLPASLSLNPREVIVAASIRVPSSHEFDGENNLVVGRVETELPIISSHVVQLGNPLSQGRINSQISAKVTLTGTDDAGFDAVKTLYIPINFLSSALPTS